MPILKGDKPPIEPKGNCLTCSRISTDCPVKSAVASALMKNSSAFVALPLAETPCGGKSYGAAAVSASMAKAMATGKVKFVGTKEAAEEYRINEATSSTLKEE